jgi:hypothetical protein
MAGVVEADVEPNPSGERIMTEERWLSCTRPAAMLAFLQKTGKASERKLRLFSCACCRRVWDLLPPEESRQAVLVAERFADGLASADELTSARSQADRPARNAAARPIHLGHGAAGEAAAQAAAALVGQNAYGRVYEAYGKRSRKDAPQQVARDLGLSAVAAEDPRDAYLDAQALEAKAQATLLRDLFSNPFRAMPPIAPAWLDWNGGTVVSLAQSAYEHRLLPGGQLDPERLAVLCDALLDAGCPPDHELLLHLRGPEPHIRGCFAVDWILGRQ